MKYGLGLGALKRVTLIRQFNGSYATMKIDNPLIELLAIKLYEHDFVRWPMGDGIMSWVTLPEDEREDYRKYARGEVLWGGDEEEYSGN